MHTQECTLQALSDHLLLQRATTGDQSAFEELVHRYYASLFQLGYHYLREYHLVCDVMQHVFLQFYLSLPSLQPEKSLRGWLAQVTRNRCIDELRRRRLILFSELDMSEDEEDGSALHILADPDPLPEEVVEDSDLRQRLLRAIAALPPRYRSVVHLRYSAQLTYLEIAQRLNLPIGTVKAQFYRARSLLHAALTESLSDYLVGS